MQRCMRRPPVASAASRAIPQEMRDVLCKKQPKEHTDRKDPRNSGKKIQTDDHVNM